LNGKDNRIIVGLQKQGRHILYISSILSGGAKKTYPMPLFDSPWWNKEDISYTSIRFSVLEQRRHILYLSSILSGGTKKTYPKPLFDSL
jgi:hypothetical protein